MFARLSNRDDGQSGRARGGDRLRDHVAGIAMDRAQASRDAFVAGGGTIVEMDPAEREAWAMAMPNIAQEWATNLDAKGEPGSEMLNAYLGKLEEAGYTPLRDWAAPATN